MSIRQPSTKGYHPLHYACLNGSIDIVRYILEKDPLEIKETNDKEVYCFICLAINSNFVDILRILIENGAKHLQCCNFDLTSLATQHENVDCFKVLYEAGMIQPPSKYSLLMNAVSSRSEALVQYLLENGEDPYYMTDTFHTALSAACLLNQENIVKLLCDHMDVVDIDPNLNERAAVHWICQSNNPEIVRMVLKKGIDVNRRDNLGNSGLHYLCNDDGDVDIAILEQLLHAGLDLNGEGIPILYEMVDKLTTKCKVVKWLLDHGADPNAVVPTRNKTIAEIVEKKHNQQLRALFPTKKTHVEIIRIKHS